MPNPLPLRSAWDRLLHHLRRFLLFQRCILTGRGVEGITAGMVGAISGFLERMSVRRTLDTAGTPAAGGKPGVDGSGSKGAGVEAQGANLTPAACQAIIKE